MIVLDLSILNQKGTPMFNSDTFANRPAFGIVGRIFISIDTAAIYRDTGTAWDLIADGGSTSTNIYNSNGTLSANRIVSDGGFSLTFNPSTTFDTTLTAANNASSLALFGVNRLSYAAAFSANNIGALYGASSAFALQTFAGNATFANSNVASGGSSVNSIDFSSGGSTITMTQSSGIRVMSGQQNLFQYQGTNSGTITHAAISQNTGFYRPTAATGILTITNAYSHLINALDDYGAGFTFTNRWGIYQAGASDLNYFASKVLIGSTTDIGVSKLQVTGNGNFTGSISAVGLFGYILKGRSSDNFGAFGFYDNTGATRYGYIQSASTNGGQLNITMDGGGQIIGDSRGLLLQPASGNVLIGTSTDNGQKLQVIGSVKFSAGINDFESDSSTNYCLKLRNINANSYGLFIQSASTPNSGFPLINITDSTAATSYFRVDSGTGNVGINTSPGTQKLYLNGSFRIDGQTSGSAGGSSGQHLIINCDGTSYKIALLNT